MLLCLNFFLIIIQFNISKINTIKMFNQSEKRKSISRSILVNFALIKFWLNFNSILISNLIMSLGLFDTFLHKTKESEKKRRSASQTRDINR